MMFQSEHAPSLPMIADGSIRSCLLLAEPHPPEPPEALNLTSPETVQDVHAQFLASGAILHRTNTHAANRVALAPYQLEERSEAINNSGSALTRAAIGVDGLMMGAIGEIKPGPGNRQVPLSQRERAYSEQAVYLSDTGVTFLLLEHFSHVEEALRVLRIARSASDAPVLAQLRLDVDGNSADGLPCAEAARRLADGGAGALGISCGPAPDLLPPLVKTLVATGLPVSVMLGIRRAGLPHPYPGAPALTPTAFAEALAGFADMGAAILGGCCGCGPEHIRALSRAVAGRG
ncbi:MAG: homocysteine S-methyltransferase family protein [SAR324 cluster bacterium]|nr:homocysteine S-methyltransferase family protein [SAR324 cluster bacterium]